MIELIIILLLVVLAFLPLCISDLFMEILTLFIIIIIIIIFRKD